VAGDLTPAAFIGHGSPMNAIEWNRFTEAWTVFGEELRNRPGGGPRAVLAVSAHWYVPGTAVTAQVSPPTIHDFQGFPPELFAVQYPAPGDPGLAAEVAELLGPTPVACDATSWGIDHATWSVLRHIRPEADLPVLQLSIDSTATPEDHLALGARLSPLREMGVFVLATGNVVHNLRRMNWSAPESATGWAQRFDDATRAVMADRPAQVMGLVDHPDFDLASPSPEHFLPLVYLAGLATITGERPRVLVDGIAYGSVSMTSWVLDGSPDMPS
jgi:4,5-DOPA dioxygenase extradiol